LRGWVTLGNKRIKFEIPIPGYQRLLRLSLKVSLKKDKLVVTIKDYDFPAKKAFYNAAYKQLK
jgi:hypothetical protein